MISIVVPAHNEGSVISRMLTASIGGSGLEDVIVTVVCNGCTDDTTEIARRFSPSVRVIETAVANKTHALNLGDQASSTFPRIYVDADVIITHDAIRALAARLERGDVLAAAPMPDINVTGCSRLVRAYFGVRARLPSAREGIGGSGVYALSAAGRDRFAQFPDVVADDTYVRLQFKPEERETLSTVKSVVFAPRTIKQLIVVRTRAYIGTFELARRFPDLWRNRGEANNRALMTLFKHPRLWLGLLTYCYVNVLARINAAVLSRNGTFFWYRDDSSRHGLVAGSTTGKCLADG
jgi:glycosyltransferase involved in cell wall biosynthesis